MNRHRARAVLLALGFVVGLAVGLVTCAHGDSGFSFDLSTEVGLRAAFARLP